MKHIKLYMKVSDRVQEGHREGLLWVWSLLKQLFLQWADTQLDKHGGLEKSKSLFKKVDFFTCLFGTERYSESYE